MGHVQRDLAQRFKIFCTDKRITIAEALDQAIVLFLQQSDGEAKDPELSAKNEPPTFDTTSAKGSGGKSKGKKKEAG
ncbi:MAG: hypothetical protein ABI417_00590 [Coleofasciculaceae cyanobacterium]